MQWLMSIHFWLIPQPYLTKTKSEDWDIFRTEDISNHCLLQEILILLLQTGDTGRKLNRSVTVSDNISGRQKAFCFLDTLARFLSDLWFNVTKGALVHLQPLGCISNTTQIWMEERGEWQDRLSSLINENGSAQNRQLYADQWDQ